MSLKKFFLLVTTMLFCFGIFVMAVPVQAKTFKIGAVFSATGRTSFLGDPEKKTAMMLVEQINKAGGINGN